MTYFFATPSESEDWLTEVTNSMFLVRSDERLPAGALRSFVWPIRSDPPPTTVPGVIVDHPELVADTLARGRIAFKSSAFSETTAAQGTTLVRRLVRSLRQIAVVPLFAVAWDSGVKDSKPSAWGTEVATSGAFRLRTSARQGVFFEP